MFTEVRFALPSVSEFCNLLRAVFRSSLYYLSGFPVSAALTLFGMEAVPSEPGAYIPHKFSTRPNGLVKAKADLEGNNAFLNAR